MSMSIAARLFVLALACMSHSAFSATLHVWQGSPNPSPPYTTWSTAAHVIQEAVDAAGSGDEIMVTNGVYATGERASSGGGASRVEVDKSVIVRSVNGPHVTSIQGYQLPETIHGYGAIRCVYLTDGAVLSGFTLTNGATGADGNILSDSRSGAGVWCRTVNAVVTNCVLSGNSASSYGGGANNGTFIRCILVDNWASSGGGAAGVVMLYNCILSGNDALMGGGAYGGTLYHCVLNGNGASEGGGAYESTLYNCIVSGNSALDGAGTYGSALTHCTVTANHAASRGGGAFHCEATNSILYYNTAGFASHTDYDPLHTKLYHCCTSRLPSGEGNITDEPAFLNTAAGDYHLTYVSPCIDKGTNLSGSLTNDPGDNPRPLDGDGDGVAGPDIGAYEFDLRTVVPADWFASYGLDPTDPNVVSGNPDDDRQTTFQEWVADTDPTNGQSQFHIDHMEAGAPATVYFQSSSSRHYTLFYATDLDGACTVWTRLPEQTTIQGSGGMDKLTDTNAAGQKFYKVGVDAQLCYLQNMVWIPPGTFVMGSPMTEAERFEWEGPQTEVTITRGFWMGKYELTQREYERVMGSDPSRFTGDPQRPVEQVTWLDATNYCALLTEQERVAQRLPDGYVYRLPTEAEWEYACRAGTTTAFHYGDQLRSGMANFYGQREYDASVGLIENPNGTVLGYTTSVGSYAPNAWGLYDMHGNVKELCLDWDSPALPGGRVTDPVGPVVGSWRVERGGGCSTSGKRCRSAYRQSFWPEDSWPTTGFRVVLGHPYPLE